MEKIAIIGAGGFGREIKMLIDQINRVTPSYQIVGFYDDDSSLPSKINGVPFLGTLDNLINSKESISLAMGIANPAVKSDIIDKLKGKDFQYPVLKHPSGIIGTDDVSIGEGTIICAGNIITCNISIGKFVTLNLSCTVGHDTI